MARYKLPATVVLLHVCRLSAEANGPTDLLHRTNNINDQHMAAREGGVRAHRTGATAAATRTYRGNNFVDPDEYSDAEIVSLTPAGDHNTLNAAGTGDGNRMRARRMKRTKTETRAESANGKSAKGIARNRQRRGFRANYEHDAYDDIANRALSKPLDLDPIDIVDSTNSTTPSTNTNSTTTPAPTLPRDIINSTPDIDSDPTPDHDLELDRFRTDHIFDPHYNGGDVIELEKEMRDGGVAFEYDESSPSPINKNDFEVDFGSYSVAFSGSFSTDFGRSCKSSKGSGKGKGKGKGKGYGKGRCKSSKSSGKGGTGKGRGKGGSGKGGAGKGRGKGGSGKGGLVHEDGVHVYEESHGTSPKSAKSANNHRSASPEESQRQRYLASWKNDRNLRGEGEADEDRMAALREEEDPSLQGVAAVIAAHQQREDRQRKKKLQRRRNRTPEEKARDRALETSARRR